MPAMGMLDVARAHFPELNAYLLCYGAPLGKDPNAGEPENGKVHAAKSSNFFTRNGELFKVTIPPQSAMANM